MRSQRNWTALIDDMVAGRWTNPQTGTPATVPYESIVLADTLEGRESELVRDLNLGERFTVVADAGTYEALGRRVEKALRKLGPVDTVILDDPHATMKDVARVKDKLAGAEAVVAVGSGTINDLCKYVTGLDGRRYCIFGTAASMNGYTSTTASITLETGLKVSLPSHAPAGFFGDLSVAAKAPSYLAAAGFGDCLVRSVAQIDWWMSHRLLGTAYHELPFILQHEDEAILNARAHLLPQGDINATGSLYRVLTLCGLGVSFTGTSNHGSMGEHQISHYVDCFAGTVHPGTLHGQQVGVATLTMGRLQQRMLASETAPVLRPTVIDPADMERRMGSDIAAQCLAEFRKKALDSGAADAMNAKLAALWPTLRSELSEFMLPVEAMEELLRSAGGALTAADLDLPAEFYREAVIHAREMRNRYSFLDLAADAGFLAEFAAQEH